MSTKIYEAYVTSDALLLEKFVFSFREKCYSHIAKAAKLYMSCVADDYIAERKSKIKHDGILNNSMIDQWIRLELVFKNAWETSRSGENDLCNFDCSLNVFLYKSKFYIIPYKPDRGFKSPKIKGVDDFSYWNNTDEPEDIDIKEWRNRGKIWDKISEQWNRYRFSYEIFEGKDMYCYGQRIVEDKILGKQFSRELPSACFSAVVEADIEHREKRKSRELT